MDVAVIGNSGIFGGFAVAADLALAGHAVRLAVWPGTEATLEPVRARGGLELAGDTAHATAGRGGLAQPTICGSLREAVAGVEVVVLDVAPPEFEARFAELVDHLQSGQIVHVNLHGYWPVLRLAPLLRAAGKAGVTLSEGAAPTIAADYSKGVVRLQWMRRKVPVAIFPANRRAESFPKLKALFSNIVEARNVLETGVCGLNMMVHFPLVLLNIASCDRAGTKEETVHFYGPGSTRNTARLAEAQDRERQPVGHAYGVPVRSVCDHLNDYYDSNGSDFETVVANASYYRTLPPYPADAWSRWLEADMPFAYVPFVAFAERAGVQVPLHRAAIAISGALLGRDLVSEGATLDTLGLADCSVAQIKRYVETGKLPQAA